MTENKAKIIIDNSIANDRLAHAYVFNNPKGDKYLAEYLIYELTKIDKGKILTLDGTSGHISKEDVLNVLNEVQMTTSLKGPKIIYIKDVDSGNKYSLNALLKFIEEPSDNTYIIMTTRYANKVISTILSRSQVIRENTFDFDISFSFFSHNKVSTKHSIIMSNIIEPNDKILEFYQEEGKKIIFKIENILSDALENKNEISSNLDQIITEDNYWFVMPIVNEFYNDVWRIKEGIKIIFDNKVNTLMTYSSNEFDFKKAIMSINEFMSTRNMYLNFELSKSKMLAEIARCYA